MKLNNFEFCEHFCVILICRLLITPATWEAFSSKPEAVLILTHVSLSSYIYRKGNIPNGLHRDYQIKYP